MGWIWGESSREIPIIFMIIVLIYRLITCHVRGCL